MSLGNSGVSAVLSAQLLGLQGSLMLGQRSRLDALLLYTVTPCVSAKIWGLMKEKGNDHEVAVHTTSFI